MVTVQIRKLNDEGFESSKIPFWGNKYLIGNGYFGVRGTMEEYTANELVAVNLAGFFDLAECSNWRESVNAPNPLYTVVSVDNKELNLSQFGSVSHKQTLNIRNGIHSRNTIFNVNGVNITIRAVRFVSMVSENIIALKYSVCADKDIEVILKTGIDKNIWNISGNHLNFVDENAIDNRLVLNAETVQLKNKLSVYEMVIGLETVNSISLVAVISP